MSEFDELESKIQNREQFNLLVSKTLITPLILLLISNIECAQEVVNHRYLRFQRWYEVEIWRSYIHYELITISNSTDLVLWLVCNLQTKYRFLLTAKTKNHITN